MTDQIATENKPIISYCVEHAKTQQSKCEACTKTIPHKSLRVGEIYRKNKKVKKILAKHTWYHFKCWKVPEYLTRIPIDQFRGYPTLNEKDKARIQRVIQAGVGASWEELMEKSKPVKTEKELETEKEKKDKKDQKAKEGEETLNMDLTDKLTGVQGTQTKEASEKKNNKKTAEKKTIEKKTTETKSEPKDKKKDKTKKLDKKSKAIKKEAPAKAKEVKLPKEDLLELEKFAKEFSAFK